MDQIRLLGNGDKHLGIQETCLGKLQSHKSLGCIIKPSGHIVYRLAINQDTLVIEVHLLGNITEL